MSVYRTAPPKEKAMKSPFNWQPVSRGAVFLGINGLIYKIFSGGWDWSLNLSVIKYMFLIQLLILCIYYNANKMKYFREVEENREFHWYVMPKTFMTRLSKFGIWFSVNGTIYSIFSGLSNYSVLPILILLNMILVPIINAIVDAAMARSRVE